MFKILKIGNWRWGDAEHTVVICDVAFAGFGGEVLPFSTSANADTAHGAEIWELAKKAKVAEFQE